MIAPGFELERSADVVRRNEKNFVAGPHDTVATTLPDNIAIRHSGAVWYVTINSSGLALSPFP